MLMGVDEPRQQELAPKIDLPRSLELRRRQLAVGKDRGNALAIGHHRHVRLDRPAGSVDQRSVPEDRATAGVRRLERRGADQEE
jgi:hypothetical protein